MNTYLNFINRQYREFERTGKSKVKFPDVGIVKKTKLDMLQETSGVSNLYKCGHKAKDVTVKFSHDLLTLYSKWLSENPYDLCLGCWINNKVKDV